MTPSEELSECARSLLELRNLSENPDISVPLVELTASIAKISATFSGSWQGYHSTVYYEDFKPPPAGAHFSQEWGLQRSYTGGTKGAWREYSFDAVKQAIDELCTNSDLDQAREAAQKTTADFDLVKAEVVSIIQSELDEMSDEILSESMEEIKKLTPVTPFEISENRSPKGQIVIRDIVAVNGGTQIPPHVAISSEVDSIRHIFGICDSASRTVTKVVSHLQRRHKKDQKIENIGTKVFIGHGRSLVWRYLKDFVQDRLELAWDEFNRVPVPVLRTPLDYPKC